MGDLPKEKSLEMRVAELEDKLSKIHITEDEMKAFQKVSGLLGGGGGVQSGCILDCSGGCINECAVRACTIVRSCIIRQCIIFRQCINECGGGGWGQGGGGGFSGGGFSGLGG